MKNGMHEQRQDNQVSSGAGDGMLDRADLRLIVDSML